MKITGVKIFQAFHYLSIFEDTMHQGTDKSVIPLHNADLLMTTRLPRISGYGEPLHQFQGLAVYELGVAGELGWGPCTLNQIFSIAFSATFISRLSTGAVP